MGHSNQLLVVVLAATLASIIAAAAGDLVTTTDHHYLESIKVAVPIMTETQQRHLHVLINDQKTSGKTKEKVVKDYLMNVAIDNIWQGSFGDKPPNAAEAERMQRNLQQAFPDKPK